MVREVRIMTMEIITEAQDYLTVVYGDRRRRILNIMVLLENHPTDAVIRFMKSLLREKEKMLRKYILRDKTDPRLDDLVAVMFRIYMCIQVLESEVTSSNELIKQGATEGSGFSGGDGSGYSSSR
jgi:hypothetical protein